MVGRAVVRSSSREGDRDIGMRVARSSPVPAMAAVGLAQHGDLAAGTAAVVQRQEREAGLGALAGRRL